MNEKSRKLYGAAAAVLAAALILSSVSTFLNSKSHTEDDSETRLRSDAQLVASEITGDIMRPMTVSKAMAEDINLKELLRRSETDPEGTEADMADYLTSMRDGLGYKMMFAVSDKTGAYYTCDGISYYMDKGYQGNSQWYGDFKESGKDWDLDVDVEESTGWTLSVFVNQLVTDSSGEDLGVCGTAVDMTRLQNTLELYERMHQIKIDVTDADGLILMDTDEERIEKDSLTLPDTEGISDGEIYYEKGSDGDRVVTYMDDIGMYLVVTDTDSDVASIISDIKLSLICAILGLIAAGGLIIFALKEERLS